MLLYSRTNHQVGFVVMFMAAFFLLFGSGVDLLRAEEVTFIQTGTGFFYPTGMSSFPYTCGTWLGRDPANGGCYLPEYYHIGYDMMYGLNNPVYAIAPGTVYSVSPNNWGTGNVGLLIKHTLSNGSEFLALYGHITTNLVAGDRVTGGVEIGRVGYWSNGNHLHFGIVPNTTPPSNNLGAMPNDSWPSTNGLTDPTGWITSNTPKCTNGTAERYRPYGNLPLHPNGSIVQVYGNPAIYVLQNGQKRMISSPQRLWELYGPGRGFDFRDVVIISQAEMDRYPRGADVIDALTGNGRSQPDGRLIQQWGGAEVSIVTDNGTRRPFTGQAFLNLAYQFCNIAGVSDYYSYPVGSTVTE